MLITLCSVDVERGLRAPALTCATSVLKQPFPGPLQTHPRDVPPFHQARHATWSWTCQSRLQDGTESVTAYTTAKCSSIHRYLTMISILQITTSLVPHMAERSACCHLLSGAEHANKS